MPIDNIFLSFLVKELKGIENQHIDKIHCPSGGEFVFVLRHKKLFVNLNGTPYITLLNESFLNPENPPMFCMLLRKHLTGGRLVNVYQPDMERIIVFEFETRNELGDITSKKLIVELMGRYSNIILTDGNDRVIDCSRLVDPSVNSVRVVMPGVTYQSPPPQNKISPFDIGEEEIKKILFSCPKEQKMDGYILEKFAGISPTIAREPIFRAIGNTDLFAGQATDEMIVSIAHNLYEIFSVIKNGNYTPGFMLDESGTPFDFSAIEIKQFAFKRAEVIAERLDDFYISRELKGRMSQKSSDIMKIVVNLIERYAKKSSILKEDIKKAENKEKYRLYGDIITANIYKIKKGDLRLITENFYSEECEEIIVPLDADLTPSENAQKYYARYNKLKNTLIFAKEQLEKTQADIVYLTSVQVALENCENLKELAEIKSELVGEGYIKRSKLAGNKKEKPAMPEKFLSSDGFEILVGKNNKQNDNLTLKLASGNDIWFHTKNIPGSHTVIVSGGKKVPDTTMTEAAMLAAYYSKARNSVNVPVDYTIIKNVKKPAGAKAGMVIYVDYKTAYVTPNEEKIKELKKV